jgi:DNA-binding NarL/FixJ family response regulator
VNARLWDRCDALQWLYDAHSVTGPLLQCLLAKTAILSLRILIVDDNEHLRAGLRQFLQICDDLMVCGEAVDGVEAVEKAIELKPDVILMDVTMPRLNSLEATRLIREKVPQSEVVILSQHSAQSLEQVAIKAGALACVEKSEIATALCAAVEAAGRHQSFREPGS